MPPWGTILEAYRAVSNRESRYSLNYLIRRVFLLILLVLMGSWWRDHLNCTQKWCYWHQWRQDAQYDLAMHTNTHRRPWLIDAWNDTYTHTYKHTCTSGTIYTQSWARGILVIGPRVRGGFRTSVNRHSFLQKIKMPSAGRFKAHNTAEINLIFWKKEFFCLLS